MTTSGRLGSGIVIALVGLAVVGPWIAGDPAAIDLGATLAGPTPAHPFGQDALGRDLLARVIWGARISLLVGLATVTIAITIGTVVGLVSGLAGGWIDALAMRTVDVLLAFPGILLAIAISAMLGPSLTNVVLALSVIAWTGTARLVRAETRALRARPHVEAARALGAAAPRVLAFHILPSISGPLAVQATFGLAGAIVAEASLSFLGLGAQPPTPSWGAMLNDGRTFLLVAPHVAFFPGAAVFVAVLGINFLGDALRDRLDVRGRHRRRAAQR